ncbi:serine/threonine protein kinase [Streptomyces sp. NBC_01497]
MGRVWRAQDELLHRTVAVKELTAGLYATEADREVLHGRTRTEARAAARISHPNVVTVHDVLEHDGRPWIVMQYVDGRSLSDVVKESAPVEAREAARIGLAVLGALRAAHAAGVLHRDVKPANVMLARDGQVLLADFGIAAVEGDTSVTRTGELIGSVEYLAPERVRGEAPGPAGDLWSLGATLYTAVQGISPYHRDSALSTLQAVIVDDVPYPSAAGELAPVIVAMLQKDAGLRPDADACARLLTEVAEGRQADTTAYPTGGLTLPVSSYGIPRGPGPQAPHQSSPHQPDPYGQDPYGQGPSPRAGQAETHARHAGTLGPAAGRGPAGPDGQMGAGPYGATGGYGGPGPHGRPVDGAPAQAATRAGTGAGRRTSRGRAVVLAVLAAVVIGGGVGYGVTQFGGESGGSAARGQSGGSTADPATRGSGDTDSAASGGGSAPDGGSSPGQVTPSDGAGAPDAQSVPKGWQRVDAPEGFSLWLPKGYVRVPGVGTIDYSPDDDQHFVRISIDTQPDFPSPLDHLDNLEASGGKVGTLPDYHRVTLGPDTYRDQKQAARWEFTWTQAASQGVPGPRTAVDLMYVDDDTGAEYALYMSGPTADWSDARFSTVLRGWQPPADPGA